MMCFCKWDFNNCFLHVGSVAKFLFRVEVLSISVGFFMVGSKAYMEMLLTSKVVQAMNIYVC